MIAIGKWRHKAQSDVLTHTDGAAQLMAFAEAQRSAIDVETPEECKPLVEHALNTIRNELSESDFRLCCNLGKSLYAKEVFDPDSGWRMKAPSAD